MGVSRNTVDRAKTLAWNEPGAYKRAAFWAARRDRPFDPVPWLIALGISAALIGSAVYRNKPFLADSWPATIAMSVLEPPAFLLVIVWISLRGGDVVIVSENWINRNGTQGAKMVVRYWPWERVTSCELGPVEVDSQRFDALTAHFDDGTRESFALSPKVTPDAAEAAVRANRIAVRRA
jgi:hypothetical protein